MPQEVTETDRRITFLLLIASYTRSLRTTMSTTYSKIPDEAGLLLEHIDNRVEELREQEESRGSISKCG